MNKQKISEILDFIKKRDGKAKEPNGTPLNIFRNISEKEFNKQISLLIEKNDKKELSQSDLKFELAKIISLLKDAHSSIMFNDTISLFHKLDFIENEILFHYKGNTYRLEKINGTKIKDIKNKIIPIISSETIEWQNCSFLKYINKMEILKIIGVINDYNENTILDYSVSKVNLINGKVIYNKPEVLSLNWKAYDNTVDDIAYKTNYALIKKDNVHILRYSKCVEDKNYPFDKFYADIENQLKNGEKIIVDLRNNTGGFSCYFDKIIEILKSKNITGYCIINNNVFSGGIWAWLNLKTKLNFITIGQQVGQPLKRYGNCIKRNFDDIHIAVSTTFFDLTSRFANDKYKDLSTKPDIEIKPTIKDYMEKYDKPLNVCFQKITKNNNKEK